MYIRALYKGGGEKILRYLEPFLKEMDNIPGQYLSN